MTTSDTGLVRTVMGTLFIAILVVGSFLVLKPFLIACIWAMTIAVALWPRVLWLREKLGGRKGAAATLLTLGFLLLLVVPVTLAVGTIVEHGADLVDRVRTLTVPPPPNWVRALPLVGGPLAERWDGLAAAGSGGIVGRAAPYMDDLGRWFLARVGGLGALLVQMLLTVILSAMFFLHGEQFAGAVRRFAVRVGGEMGDRAVTLAGQAVRGVALGVVVTALVQAGLATLGLALAGVPFAPILGAIMLILCIAQIGPMLVLIPVTIWGFGHIGVAWAVFLLVWTIVVGTLDNWLRPILIRRGVDLPLLLIFAGVIGGLIAFGLIGIFIGPVVLAVTYTLLGAWVDGGVAAAKPDPAS